MKKSLCVLTMLSSLLVSTAGTGASCKAIEPTGCIAIAIGATTLSALSAAGYKIYTMKSNSTVPDINSINFTVENSPTYIHEDLVEHLNQLVLIPENKNVCPYISKSTQPSSKTNIAENIIKNASSNDTSSVNKTCENLSFFEKVKCFVNLCDNWIDAKFGGGNLERFRVHFKEV